MTPFGKVMTMEQHDSIHGWSPSEDSLLNEAVLCALKENRPKRSAFEAVAARTGRSPNSVRNRYYAKENPSPKRTASFTPFTESETDALLRQILLAKANGESVRACTLRLSSGDTNRMLRYQNKYRSILKNRPEQLLKVRQALLKEGYEIPDPTYRDPNQKYVGRPPKRPPNQNDAIRALLDALDRENKSVARRLASYS